MAGVRGLAAIRMSTLRDTLLNATALDIETAPEPGHPQEYALQPWRVGEGKAKITCISIAKHTGEAMLTVDDWRTLLVSLRGQYITTWNGLFDVAWLIANGLWEEVKAINWVDGMLLWKWLSNSQYKERIPKWSLADGAKKFCKDEPWLDAFIQMKAEEQHAGENTEYWETRAKLDAIVTAKICHRVVSQLGDRQIQSAMIEMAIIPEVARSWLIGVPYDYSLMDEIRPTVVNEMRDLEFKLGVSNFKGASADRVKRDPSFWSPSKIFRSPAQLGTLLYETWGLTVKSFTEKLDENGNRTTPSTDKSALTYLADDDDRVLDILRWRELNTQFSKYLESPKKARAYLGKDTVHPSPRLFSTYTGRMTYSSKTAKRYQTGIALHQWPRNKALRALVKPLPGYDHVEFDAAGQESRLMAEQSGDEVMRNIFKNDMDFHSFTGAAIGGMTYDDFILAKEKGNTAVTGEHGLRYAGKFLNLSQNFRVGVRKMRIQARVQYGLNVDFLQAKSWQDTFQGLFPGIKKYWSKSIDKGKTLGYTESLGGRRFQLEHWSGDDRWSTESSALMFPIQGSGADMAELGLRELCKHFPDFIFWFSLHDGHHFLVPKSTSNERLFEAREMLNNINYEKEWGCKLTVPLLWDVSRGSNWSELKEL